MVCMCTPVPSGMGPSEGLCAHGVGPESEGVQAGWVPCGHSLCWCYPHSLSVYMSSSPAAFQRVWVQNASVVVADLLATNGVLHVLSQVWLEGGVRTGKLLVRPRGGDVLSGPRALCQVLLPPQGAVPAGQGLLQQLDSVPAFHLFRELLQVRAGGGGASGQGHPPPGCVQAAGSQGED